MSIAAGTRVQLPSGRIGVALYDITAIPDTDASVFVAFADQTYREVPRGTLTSLAGGFFDPIGPGN